MKQEDKELLLKDLCARLYYGVKVTTTNCAVELGVISGISIAGKISVRTKDADIVFECTEIKPYLRPISSMTDEEFNSLKEETALNYNNQLDLVDWNNGCKTLEFWLKEIPSYVAILVFDWLNSHHFDYRALIDRGLALDCTGLHIYD